MFQVNAVQEATTCRRLLSSSAHFVHATGRLEGEKERVRVSRERRLMDWKKDPPTPRPPLLVVSQVSNRGRNFILQVADLMIQRVINGLIILMLNMASSNYTDLLSVKVWPPPLPLSPRSPPNQGAGPAGRRTIRRWRRFKNQQMESCCHYY